LVCFRRAKVSVSEPVGHPTTLSSDLESKLAVWVRELRKEQLVVTPSMICDKALEMARDANIPTVPSSEGRRDFFAASYRWYQRFARDYHFGTFKLEETRNPTDRAHTDKRPMTTALHDLLRDLSRVVQRYNLPQSLVFTMDETPLLRK
jgi:hypothetical protein